MERIASFEIDHLTHPAGIHLSRVDGDIYTYDLRFCAPYKDALLTNSELHSVEHLLATFLRNGANKDKVIYAGPMGCQTGFYILYRNLPLPEARADILDALVKILGYEGEMPGNSERECGYCYNLSVESAKNAVKLFLDRYNEN